MKLVTVYENGLFECQMIVNLLQNEGIESTLQDVITGARGGIGMYRPAGGVRVVVAEDNFEAARRVVEKFEAANKEE